MKVYLVGEARRKISVRVADQKIPVSLIWAGGMIGAMPIFDNREEAKQYAEENGLELYSIETEEVGDDSRR